MMRQLTQGEVEYLKKLLLAHSNMGKVIADLMVAMASGSEPDVAKSHKQLLEVSTYIKLAVDPDYSLIYESKPGPKKGRKTSKKGSSK
jgi:hypothetical protein